jgi:O-succinylbenzoic acid--CoA ligase
MLGRCSYDVVVPDLVAFDLPSSATLFAEVVRQWEQGNAVTLIDQRLAPQAKQRCLEITGATKVIDARGSSRLPAGREVEDGDALVVLTSGSTGAPRAAVHTHESIAASVRGSALRLGARPTDHWLLCIPPSHVGGFSVFCRAHLGGNEFGVLPSFDTEEVMRAAKRGATHVSLVLTALQRIDADAFDVILLGGSRMPANLPSNVVTTYGLTETMGGIVYDGRPLDGVEIRIVDGEIHVKCAMLMRGYRDGSSPGEWFPTGDLGTFDELGRLVVEGRRGHLIVTGGEKVWPHQVEDALVSHPDVIDCAVLGIPDDEWGARVVAWVVSRSDRLSLAEIRGWVRDRLSTYHAPKEIRLVQRIPRTALGKIDEPALLDSPWH